MDLQKIRQEIDQIDEQLVSLLEKRMDLVSQIVEYKRSADKPILDKGREHIIFEKVANQVENKQYQETILATFSDILSHSRSYQEKHLS